MEKVEMKEKLDMLKVKLALGKMEINDDVEYASKELSSAWNQMIKDFEWVEHNTEEEELKSKVQHVRSKKEVVDSILQIKKDRREKEAMETINDAVEAITVIQDEIMNSEAYKETMKIRKEMEKEMENRYVQLSTYLLFKEKVAKLKKEERKEELQELINELEKENNELLNK